MSKHSLKTWAFRSESNPKKVYQTIYWNDGTLSCNCPGYCKRSIRECKHTRSVELGMADLECEACTGSTKPKHRPTPEMVRSFDFE